MFVHMTIHIYSYMMYMHMYIHVFCNIHALSVIQTEPDCMHGQ